MPYCASSTKPSDAPGPANRLPVRSAGQAALLMAGGILATQTSFANEGIMPRLYRNFDKIDLNQNGAVTLDEIRQAAAQLRQTHSR